MGDVRNIWWPAVSDNERNEFVLQYVALQEKIDLLVLSFQWR